MCSVRGMSCLSACMHDVATSHMLAYMHRSLTTLNLGGNRIGPCGATEMAGVSVCARAGLSSKHACEHVHGCEKMDRAGLGVPFAQERELWMRVYAQECCGLTER